MSHSNIILIFALAFGCSIQMADMAYLDVGSFFNVTGNLTRVSWAHAVNSQTLLNDALNSTVMMLEADVVIGNLVSNSTNSTNIPIMAHPPATISDLSLEQFLSQVYHFNNIQGPNGTRKGVKLDFKTIAALERSVSIIEERYTSMTYPVWINADIISGPVNPTTAPVDPRRFFNATSNFNNSTLSVGWTTNYKNGTTNGYTNGQITSMLTSIQQHNVNQSITFPVRAVHAAESISQMNTLLRNVSGSTLTIWSSDGDNVNVTRLRNLIRDVGIRRVYIDVPNDLEKQLNLNTLGGAGMLAPLVSVVSVMLALMYIL